MVLLFVKNKVAGLWEDRSNLLLKTKRHHSRKKENKRKWIQDNYQELCDHICEISLKWETWQRGDDDGSSENFGLALAHRQPGTRPQDQLRCRPQICKGQDQHKPTVHFGPEIEIRKEILIWAQSVHGKTRLKAANFLVLQKQMIRRYIYIISMI